MFDRSQATVQLSGEIIDGIASYNHEQASSLKEEYSAPKFTDKQKAKLELLEDVFTHKTEDVSNRTQLSIPEQVRQLDKAKIETSILSSPQFKEAKPTLALALLARDFRVIHDPNTGNGITIDELRTYRDQDKKINSLDKTLIDYVLHLKDGAVNRDRFDRIRNMVRTDKILLIGGNSDGITRSDIEEARNQISAMLKSREDAQRKLDPLGLRQGVGRGMKFLDEHAKELTTADNPYKITQSSLNQFAIRHSADRELSAEAITVTRHFQAISDYVRGEDGTVDIRIVRNLRHRFAEDDELLRREFNQVQQQWTTWTEM